MGLPIVAKIFEEHGGGIALMDSQEGRGAWVRLWFPRTKTDEIDNGAATAASSPMATA